MDLMRSASRAIKSVNNMNRSQVVEKKAYQKMGEGMMKKEFTKEEQADFGSTNGKSHFAEGIKKAGKAIEERMITKNPHPTVAIKTGKKVVERTRNKYDEQTYGPTWSETEGWRRNKKYPNS